FQVSRLVGSPGSVDLPTSETPTRNLGNSETLKPLSVRPSTGVSTYEYKCSGNSNFTGYASAIIALSHSLQRPVDRPDEEGFLRISLMKRAFRPALALLLLFGIIL